MNADLVLTNLIQSLTFVRDAAGVHLAAIQREWLALQQTLAIGDELIERARERMAGDAENGGGG